MRRRLAGMKQILLICAVVALVGCGKKEEPLIADPTVERAVRERVGKPTGKLTKADLEEVRSLDFYNKRITDLSNLAVLTNLEELTLHDNQLADLSALTRLPNLKVLYLSMNQTYDLGPLAGLTKLEEVYLTNNPQLTKAQIAELQEALPKCKITHNAKK